MKNISKEIKSLVLHIQGLVIEIPEMTVYYQSEIYLLSIYSFGKNHKYRYHKEVYIDGYLSNETAVIADLKQIINDLKEIKENGYKSQSKLAI
jgi:hypothetical protein